MSNMNWRNGALFLALAVVIVAPMLLRPRGEAAGHADRTLVIVTPHNEATRYEFGRAFREYWHARTGEVVRIDWRTPGGTSEISRFVASEYRAAFEHYWTRKLGRTWEFAVAKSFDDPKLKPDATPEDDTVEMSARRAFLESEIGCGIDLFFGGGAYDLGQQANAGRLVDCGVVRAHPEIFNDGFIPEQRGGEVFWDKQGRWIGTCLSAFGICYNTDAVGRLGVNPPLQWSDLADPRFAGEIALSDPTQSGSVAKAFEMIIQQQMHAMGDPARAPEGWDAAMRMIQRIAANARYFTDSASKVPLDVELGNAAAGMCIDFYGRFQSEAVRQEDGSSRLQYVSPAGGSSVNADPIGLLRGAKNRELAVAFIEWVLSQEGQKLWGFKTGTPGGPVKFALRRLPIRPDLYGEEFRGFRSDPEVQPYGEAALEYQAAWTAPLFRPMGFIIRAMCIDTHDELKTAWRELIAAGFPREATEAFAAIEPVNYAAASGRIRETLRSANRIEHVRLGRELSEHFRAAYLRSAELARQGR
jgi:iron(III) transport system substrate-binding protein